MSRSQWSLSQAGAEMFLRGIPMKVIGLFLSLLRGDCKWRPLKGGPLFSWHLCGERDIPLSSLGGDKPWASSEPCPGVFADCDLRLLTDEERFWGGLVFEWLCRIHEWGR